MSIDPLELLDWYRLVKVYGWHEEYSIPLLMKVFELSLIEGRKVIVVGAQINKPVVEMLVRAFQKEYSEPIKVTYEKMRLEPIAKSVVYRVRSPKYPHAWFPHPTSIAKSRIERNIIAQRIEAILLSLVSKPAEFSNLHIGIVKPKNSNLDDFVTTWVKHARISSLDYGSLRGSNELEHCDPLFVIGTFVKNVEATQKDFTKLFHRKPLTTEHEKLFDGGYRYSGDSDLENYRKMCEDYEMYQAIHRARPALKQRKVFVFGLVPAEIYEEFEVRDIEVKNVEGVLRMVESKSWEEFVKEQIGDRGIFQ